MPKPLRKTAKAEYNREEIIASALDSEGIKGAFAEMCREYGVTIDYADVAIQKTLQDIAERQIDYLDIAHQRTDGITCIAELNQAAPRKALYDKIRPESDECNPNTLLQFTTKLEQKVAELIHETQESL